MSTSAQCQSLKRPTDGVKSHGSVPAREALADALTSVPSKGQRLGHSRAGPIASFIDVVGDFAIGMLVGGGVPTINPRIDYLRPAIGETITGTGRVRRQGRTVALVDIEITDREGKLVAVGRGTYAPQVG